MTTNTYIYVIYHVFCEISINALHFSDDNKKKIYVSTGTLNREVLPCNKIAKICIKGLDCKLSRKKFEIESQINF